jgi:hypothetical protein
MQSFDRRGGSVSLLRQVNAVFTKIQDDLVKATGYLIRQ